MNQEKHLFGSSNYSKIHTFIIEMKIQSIPLNRDTGCLYEYMAGCRGKGISIPIPTGFLWESPYGKIIFPFPWVWDPDGYPCGHSRTHGNPELLLYSKQNLLEAVESRSGNETPNTDMTCNTPVG